MSDIVESHLPCDDCGSSDALARNRDGSTYCFACNSHTKSKDVKILKKEKPRFDSLLSRKINTETINKYHVLHCETYTRYYLFLFLSLDLSLVQPFFYILLN